MDNKGDLQALIDGAAALSVHLSNEVAVKFLALRSELLRWNQRINLTSIIDPVEVLEKHFLDSLAPLPELEGASSLLDLGAGAGFPGLPLKLARPGLNVTLVDSVGKKVAFIKQMIGQLGLTGARAVQGRAAGDAEAEGLPLSEAVIARALMDVGPWLSLGSRYLAPGGRLVAMLGPAPERGGLEELAAAQGRRLVSLREYALPWSKAPRSLAVFA